ncbi:MAG TPA: hypothetical protein VGN73_08885 [Gemmatimonadaceae bacterium]|nr:hypothetical protein [Gemmatimonadaceae bacterium]
MLSPEESLRIREEEVVRSEVRRELEAAGPKRSFGAKVWAALNSAFLLWFLSSIVLGVLTAAVSAHQRNRDVLDRREKLQYDLRTELAGRVDEALEAMELDQRRILRGEVYPRSAIYNEVVSYLDNFFLNDPPSPLAELAKRNGSSLTRNRHCQLAPGMLQTIPAEGANQCPNNQLVSLPKRPMPIA